MSNTPVLGLPEIAEGVASQTVLHNQALRLIEARIVRVLSRTTTAPPGSPAEGDSYIVPAGATGAWSGLTNQVASFVGGGWVYLTPGEGVRLWVNDADETVVFDGAAWVLSEGSAGGSGDVVGPASSTDGHFASFDGATGKLLKDTIALDTDTTLAADSDTRVASQKAVKAYVTASAGGSASSITGTTGATGGNATVTGGTSTTAANAGGEAVMVGGTPGISGIGGIARITGGPGGTTSGVGGAVILNGGTAGGTGAAAAKIGGAVTIQGGTGSATTTAGAGGVVGITGGSGGSTSSSAGGAITITGGAGSGSQALGGAITLLAGTSAGTQTGAAVSITAGAAASGGTAGAVSLVGGAGGVGGAINATAGNSSGNALVGGAVVITAGTGGPSSGTGGAATLKGGTGGASSGVGGAANLQGGTPGSTGNAGAANVLGGTPVAGAGGAVNITGAAGVGTNMAGGNVVLRPGAATGSGNPGNIQLDGGRGAAIATTATGGFVTLPTCAGTPTGTPVNVPTGSVATVVDTSGGKLWMFIGGAWKGYVNIDEAQNTTNRIINGKMAIDQRNAGASITGGFATDRWVIGTAGSGSVVGQRNADSGEFRLLLGVAVADTTLAAADNYNFYQPVEGYNLADLQWGTAQASPVTIAFEVEATTFTGTLVLTCANGAINRSYPAPFTVNAAGVRETKVITIPGDTTGTWAKDNTAGMYVIVSLASGSSFNGTANTWQAGNIQTVPGAANFMANGSNQLRFKNFRLYKGSVDFGPDRRLYAEELALCQRYYEKSYPTDVVPGTLTQDGQVGFTQTSASATQQYFGVRFTQMKRSPPTITIYNPAVANNQIRNLVLNTDFSASGVANVSTTSYLMQGVTPAGSGVGHLSSFQFTASAEL